MSSLKSRVARLTKAVDRVAVPTLHQHIRLVERFPKRRRNCSHCGHELILIQTTAENVARQEELFANPALFDDALLNKVADAIHACRDRVGEQHFLGACVEFRGAR